MASTSSSSSSSSLFENMLFQFKTDHHHHRHRPCCVPRAAATTTASDWRQMGRPHFLRNQEGTHTHLLYIYYGLCIFSSAYPTPLRSSLFCKPTTTTTTTARLTLAYTLYTLGASYIKTLSGIISGRPVLSTLVIIESTGQQKKKKKKSARYVLSAQSPLSEERIDLFFLLKFNFLKVKYKKKGSDKYGQVIAHYVWEKSVAVEADGVVEVDIDLCRLMFVFHVMVEEGSNLALRDTPLIYIPPFRSHSREHHICPSHWTA